MRCWCRAKCPFKCTNTHSRLASSAHDACACFCLRQRYSIGTFHETIIQVYHCIWWAFAIARSSIPWARLICTQTTRTRAVNFLFLWVHVCINCEVVMGVYCFYIAWEYITAIQSGWLSRCRFCVIFFFVVRCPLRVDCWITVQRALFSESLMSCGVFVWLLLYAQCYTRVLDFMRALQLRWVVGSIGAFSAYKYWTGAHYNGSHLNHRNETY